MRIARCRAPITYILVRPFKIGFKNFCISSSSFPLHISWLLRPREQGLHDFFSKGVTSGTLSSYRIICPPHFGISWQILQPEVPNHYCDDNCYLHVSKLLTDTTMPASTKWEVRAVRPCRHKAISIIHLLLLLIFWICDLCPSMGVPYVCIWEILVAFPHGGWRSEKNM